MESEHPTIRELYPDMTDEELAAAEANLQRYVAVVLRVYDRLKSEGKAWPDPPPGFDDLTG